LTSVIRQRIIAALKTIIEYNFKVTKGI